MHSLTHQRAAAENERVGLQPAIVNRLERAHPSFNEPDKLDNADEFRRHEFHAHLPRPGGYKLQSAVLPGGDTVIF
jgi:hypothetical protein